jgi:hypothetical protein
MALSIHYLRYLRAYLNPKQRTSSKTFFLLIVNNIRAILAPKESSLPLLARL